MTFVNVSLSMVTIHRHWTLNIKKHNYGSTLALN